MTEEPQSLASPPLGKYLASTDKKTRDKAVRRLATYLSRPDYCSLPKSETAKLWKGIFYCYWMSDKPLVQQALSHELAELLLCTSSVDASLAFLKGFWESLVREWNGLDRLRMDKYYLLARKFVNVSFRLLLQNNWDKNAIQQYNSILSCNGGPLCFDDNRVPSSLSYHLADIYLEELDKAIATCPESGPQPKPVPLILLLMPFLNLAARTKSNVTFQRIHDEILEPLLAALITDSTSSKRDQVSKRPKLSLKPALDNIMTNACTEDPVRGKTERGELGKGLLKSILDISSGPDVREANRRKLYALWKRAMAECDDG